MQLYFDNGDIALIEAWT